MKSRKLLPVAGVELTQLAFDVYALPPAHKQQLPARLRESGVGPDRLLVVPGGGAEVVAQEGIITSEVIERGRSLLVAPPSSSRNSSTSPGKRCLTIESATAPAHAELVFRISMHFKGVLRRGDESP